MSKQQIIKNSFTDEQDDALTAELEKLYTFCNGNGIEVNDHKSARGNYVIELRPKQ